MTYKFDEPDNTSHVKDGIRLNYRICDVCARKKKKGKDAVVTIKILDKKYDLCSKHARKLSSSISDALFYRDLLFEQQEKEESDE